MPPRDNPDRFGKYVRSAPLSLPAANAPPENPWGSGPARPACRRQIRPYAAPIVTLRFAPAGQPAHNGPLAGPPAAHIASTRTPNLPYADPDHKNTPTPTHMHRQTSLSSPPRDRPRSASPPT